MIAYIIADCFFRDDAFKDSNNFTINLQKKLSSEFFTWFFIIFCDILHPIVASALLILYYALTLQKIKTLSFIIYFIGITYVCSVLKIIYHDPRPYWENSDVEAKECYSEYGNPSGHSMMSILLFGMFWMRYIWALVKYGEVHFLKRFQKTIDYKEENHVPLINGESENPFETVEILESGFEINERKKSSNRIDKSCFFTISSLLLLLVEFFILFGRIYLGMHSYNEVLLGFFYGCYFLTVYYLYLERKIMVFLEMIIMRSYKLKLQGFSLDFKILGILSLFYVLFIILPIILYEIYSQTLNFPENWIINVHRFCPNNSPLKMFLKKCTVDCGIMGTVFGILFGLVLTQGEYYCLKIMYSSEENPHYAFLKEITFKKQLIRVIIVIIFGGLWAAIFQLFPNKDSVYLCFFINNQLGTFLSGFFLIKLVPFMNNFFKVEYDKDFLKYKKGDLVVHSGSSMPYEEIK